MTEAKLAQEVNTLYSENDSKVLKFVCRGELFVSFFNPTSHKGCAGVFDSENLKSRFHKIVDQVNTLVGKTDATLSIKAVGSPKIIVDLHAALKDAGLTLQTEKTLNEESIELYYYPSENRLRFGVNTSQQKNQSNAKSAEVKAAKIKISIVDDSKTIRTLLKNVFSEDSEIELLWEASTPSEALKLLAQSQPDVMTVDIHMPEMNGAELIKKYIGRYPIPSVLITSLSKDDGPLVFEALENGAIDYIQKPSAAEFGVVKRVILEKVKAAAQAKIVSRKQLSSRSLPISLGNFTADCLVAIGSSTGGTEALKDVLIQLPAEIPPILVVQHIPPVFSLAFANRLNDLCPFEVKEAKDGDEVKPGRVLIAPGGFHMKFHKSGGRKTVTIENTEAVNRHKPSVDVLFQSVAQHVGAAAVGIILTGMGNDGARGLLQMKNSGARTMVQDEASCVVFGMPREAIKLGAADKVVPLLDIANVLGMWLRKPNASTRSLAAS